MHTNNPWPGKCTEDPLTKLGSGDLNPLCVTILPTSATLSGLLPPLLKKHFYSEPFSFLIHMEIIIKVQTVQCLLIPIVSEQWLMQNMDLGLTQQTSFLTSLLTPMIFSKHLCLSCYLSIPLDWFQTDRKKHSDLSTHLLTNLFVPGEQLTTAHHLSPTCYIFFFPFCLPENTTGSVTYHLHHGRSLWCYHGLKWGKL